VIHAKHRNRLPLPQPAVVHLRRSYADCRYGQIHVWTAYPSGGGFDERTPILCLHHAGGSGRLFAPVLRDLGHDRSIYAPDLPGHGSSDMPSSRAAVADIAGALGDFLDSLRLRCVDIIGYQLGALVAAELAIARPQQVRRVMLWGVAAHSPQERAALLAQAGTQANVLGSREDGSDVAEEWRQLIERRGPGVPMSALAESFSDRLRAGAQGTKALAAALDYPVTERLPLLKQPSMVLRLRDEYGDYAPRVRASLPNSSLVDLPDYGRDFLSAAPQRFAAAAREFFDR
jgi:pyruvate dehydrogenase E2 component (dihydrolipoamide acetyltransferase)